MSTIIQEITRLQNAKSSLKSSIEAKGITVASDATLDAYPALVDSIPSGGGGLVPVKEVNFYDYDGTVLYSYTAQEFAALESMPDNPVHSDLISQGWNWSLADAKTYVAANGALDIGQMYAANNPDGKTRLYITIDDISRPKMSLYFGASVNGGVTIDWGDGSSTEQSSGTSDTGYYHDYASIGDYIITLEVTSGTFSITGSDDYNIVCPSATYNYNTGRLRKVILGSGITTIGSSAFWKCYSLTSVIFSSSITSIDGSAFQNCYSLTSIILPSTLTSIGNSAFQNCYSLTSITIPSSVASIGNAVFSACYSLASITIPASVTSIGISIFNNCYSLTSITIPSSVASIGNAVFNNCYSLTSVTLPSAVTSFGTSVFAYCYCLTSITLPSSLTSLAGSSFQYCYSLTSITIPSSVTSIGGNAFKGCSGIKYYYINPITPPTLTSSSLDGVAADAIIYVPAGQVSTYKATSYWKNYASQIQAMP